MKFPFFASFIIFLLVIRHAMKRQNRQSASEEKNFWAREHRANSVRRKSLDNLDYIQIPLEQLPFDLLSEDPAVAEYQELIRYLSSHKIVNLTGFTNTDLKLEYGTANITVLSEYDQNYTLLVRTLQQWADVLIDSGHENEAKILMEFAISTDTDISKTYYKLAAIYSSRGDIFQIQQLIEKAQNLRTANKDTIVHTLQATYQ